MGASEIPPSDPLSEIMVVKVNGRTAVMTHAEIKDHQERVEIMGTIEEVLPDASPADLEQLREDIKATLTRQEVEPSTQLTELLESTEANRSVESAECSPLPAIDKSIKNPFTVKKPLVVCLVDADGTVLKPLKKHSIVLEDYNQYIIDKHPDFGGNAEEMESLRKLFNRWRKQENAKVTEGIWPKPDEELTYKKLIDESGDYHAGSMKGVSIYKVFQVGQEFVDRSQLENQFYDYAVEAIEINTQYGVYTVLVTGLPEAIAKPLTKKLGAQFYIAMKLGVKLDEENPVITIPTSEDEEGAYQEDGKWFREAPNLICTGRLVRNTGNKAGKNEAVGFMVDPDPKQPTGQHPPHSIIYGWGNNDADLPLADAGRDSYHSYDLHGFGMLINAEKDTWELTEAAHYRPKKTGKLRVFGEGTEKAKFLEELDDKLHRVFNNPRNARKIAQILAMCGYSRAEIVERFKKHYSDNPEIVADDVMKKYMLNLRDEGAMRAWLDKVQKVEGEVKITREIAVAILFANSILQSHGGSIPPEAKESDEVSTEPHSSTTDFKRSDSRPPSRSEPTYDVAKKITTPPTAAKKTTPKPHPRTRRERRKEERRKRRKEERKRRRKMRKRGKRS